MGDTIRIDIERMRTKGRTLTDIPKKYSTQEAEKMNMRNNKKTQHDDDMHDHEYRSIEEDNLDEYDQWMIVVWRLKKK